MQRRGLVTGLDRLCDGSLFEVELCYRLAPVDLLASFFCIIGVI